MVEKEKEMKAEVMKENFKNIKHKILVLSGKGGVGKSTVSVNIAYSLMKRGFKTGILDIDLHGPSVAKMTGTESRRVEGDPSGLLKPIATPDGMKVVSISSMLEKSDSPVIWRGPLKMKAIQEFFESFNWGELDYLIIDSPPGTGDEPLTVLQIVESLDGVIIVTTPQDVASSDVSRSISFVNALGKRIIGIVENMSFFKCTKCGEDHFLFGEGGAKKLAEKYNLDVIGRIPIDKSIMEHSDLGTPFVMTEKDSDGAKEYMKISEEIIKKTGEANGSDQ